MPSVTTSAQRILPNANYANNPAELVAVIREEIKEGADFIKIYQTGEDSLRNGQFSTPYQYTQAELGAAVKAEAARLGKRVAVHATGEPGALYAVRAGVASVDHAYQLSDETMRLMHERSKSPRCPLSRLKSTLPSIRLRPEEATWGTLLEFHAQQFRKQLAAGVPMAVGSDVGPFAHGTQAREFVLMVKYGDGAARRFAGRYDQRREVARLAGADRRVEAGLLRRHNCCSRQSSAGYQRPAEGFFRHERRDRLPQMSLPAGVVV